MKEPSKNKPKPPSNESKTFKMWRKLVYVRLKLPKLAKRETLCVGGMLKNLKGRAYRGKSLKVGKTWSEGLWNSLMLV